METGVLSAAASIRRAPPRAVIDGLSCGTLDIACEINAITVIRIDGDFIGIGATHAMSEVDLAGSGRDR